jgi:hypothetical protein
VAPAQIPRTAFPAVGASKGKTCLPGELSGLPGDIYRLFGVETSAGKRNNQQLMQNLTPNIFAF